ncbi:hypothetical protein BDQ17DRAFT_1429387 [Cyathus striatus]|nr:hypothetical protein BDQ17DRAFT_1429387 [Cyathus striatus]
MRGVTLWKWSSRSGKEAVDMLWRHLFYANRTAGAILLVQKEYIYNHPNLQADLFWRSTSAISYFTAPMPIYTITTSITHREPTSSMSYTPTRPSMGICADDVALLVLMKRMLGTGLSERCESESTSTSAAVVGTAIPILSLAKGRLLAFDLALASYSARRFELAPHTPAWPATLDIYVSLVVQCLARCSVLLRDIYHGVFHVAYGEEGGY